MQTALGCPTSPASHANIALHPTGIYGTCLTSCTGKGTLKAKMRKKPTSIESKKAPGTSSTTTSLPIHLRMTGRPALQKNSRNIGIVWSKKLRRKVPISLDSKNFRTAKKIGLPQLKKAWGSAPPIGDCNNRLHVEAYFLAGKGVPPDLDGACVGFGDLLQQAGIVSNDRWIASWDKSRVIEWREHGMEPQTVAVISWWDGNSAMKRVLEIMERT